MALPTVVMLPWWCCGGGGLAAARFSLLPVAASYALSPFADASVLGHGIMETEVMESGGCKA
jgi:hypothetical protein